MNLMGFSQLLVVLVILGIVTCISGIYDDHKEQGKYSDLTYVLSFSLLGLCLVVLLIGIIGFLNSFFKGELKSVDFISKLLIPLATLLVAMISTYTVYKENNKTRVTGKLQALHAESGWRITLLEVLDHVDWGPNDLEKIRNRINPKWSSGIEDISKNTKDFWIKKRIREELDSLSMKRKITYPDSFTLRQLVRMLLDNDFQFQSGNKMEFQDKTSVENCLKQASIQIYGMNNIQKIINKKNN